VIHPHFRTMFVTSPVHNLENRPNYPISSWQPPISVFPYSSSFPGPLQDRPLDLSNKDERKEKNPTQEFDMNRFLQTYYYISLRNYNHYMENLNLNPEPRLKKISESSSAGESPKRKRSSKNVKNESSPSLKKKRKIRVENACSCRFCYEDHILRMRTKLTPQNQIKPTFLH